MLLSVARFEVQDHLEVLIWIVAHGGTRDWSARGHAVARGEGAQERQAGDPPSPAQEKKKGTRTIFFLMTNLLVFTFYIFYF